MNFTNGQKIHFIGVGGYGISAIARILLERGFTVSGSDKSANALTHALAHDGATIHIGHAAKYVRGKDMVIRSSAIKDDHPEVVEAKKREIPVYKRQDILEALMCDHFVVAIAGTHGKTTTTAMTIHALRECEMSPSYIVGGIMANTGTNAGVGSSTIFVIEADEYDNMFLGLKPNLVVLTGIEYDHPDFFKSEAEMVATFEAFLDRLGDGILVACADNPHANRLAELHRARGKTTYTYGIHTPADAKAENLYIEADKTHFDFTMMSSIRLHMALKTIAEYNINNAMGAFIASHWLSRDAVCLNQAFSTFKSTGRRFELRGERNGIIIVDDYAHHPTAVRITLEGAKMRYPYHQLWAVWQPHMYSRTQTLIADYANAFASADEVVVTDIFAARENPIEGVDGAWTTAQINHPNKHYGGDLTSTARYLQENVVAPAVVIVMSAGDAPKIADILLK